MVKTTLITGITGAFGRYLLKELIHQPGEKVLLVRAKNAQEATKRSEAVLEQMLPNNIRVVCGDLAKPNLGLEGADYQELLSRPLQILHAASPTRFNYSLRQARELILTPTRNILNFAHGHNHLVHFDYISTAFVAGKHTGIINETALDDIGFINKYDQVKYEAEQMVLRSKFPTTIFRPSLIIAPDSQRSNAAVSVLDLVKHNLLPLLPGNPNDQVDLICADEAAQAIIHLMGQSSHKIYHITSGQNAPLLGAIINLAQGLTGASLDYTGHNPREYDSLTKEFVEAGRGNTEVFKKIQPFVHYLTYPKIFDNAMARRDGAILGIQSPLKLLKQIVTAL